MKQLNGRQARWATFLAPFDFYIEHRAGKKNPADAPSRRPDYAAESKALDDLLPTLQAKLAYWAETTGALGGNPVVARIRASCEQ
jgi:hypothetical protein